MTKPEARRQAATEMIDRFGRSERKACALAGVSRSCLRYEAKKKEADEALLERMHQLAAAKRRYGAGMLHTILKREGLVINHKRTERLYRAENLSLRTKKRKKLTCGLRLVLPVPTAPDQLWAADFVSDALYDGRRFRCFNLIDIYSRVCLTIKVGNSLPGSTVAGILDRLIARGRRPDTLLLDNGPEFTSRTFDAWAAAKGVKIAFIRPGKPVENAHVESFNGRFRAECLNEHWFTSLDDATTRIEEWRNEYNDFRPHSALCGLTPAEFARQHSEHEHGDKLKSSWC